MPTQNAAAAQPEEEGTFSKWFKIAQQMFLIWALTQLATRFLGGYIKGPTQPGMTKNYQQTAAAPGESSSVLTPPQSPAPNAQPQGIPHWPLGITLDMHVALSASPQVDDWSVYSKNSDGELPRFVWGNITYGDFNDVRVVDFDVKFPKTVLNNGSLWADIFLTRNGAHPNPKSPKYNSEDVHHIRKLLTPHIPKIKARKEKNLLSSGEGQELEVQEPDVVIPHWHQNVTLALVSDSGSIPISTLPPPLAEHIRLAPNQMVQPGANVAYMPIIFPNEFWHLREHYVPINDTTPSLPLQVTFQPMSFFKFQLFASMTHGFKEAAKQQGQSGSAELDEVKRMLLETNPWFLALTGFVSILHVVFEMLAFKSDVSHWRQKKEMVGVSVRTIITNVFVQVVILLYLIDNNENTSWMILMGSGMGVVIEAWKITKAVDINVIPAPPGSLIPYKLDIKDKHVLNEDEKKTQEYDKLAFRYVSYVAIPLLAGYTIYSLIYESHRGWYSFVISTLTSFVYMFGFAQLVPQLIINYKLKSVAHMPMKAMIYKTLSTVVDDLFAFCIKMPFLHRLACFRDDVVFLIFLYQRWIYRIDPKRVNEYGQVMSNESKKEQ